MIPEMIEFDLPAVIAELVLARDRVRDHYRVPDLAFNLDGKLVGDIGEAVAAEMFGFTLKTGGGTGIDAVAPDGRTVQIKANGTGRGAAFRNVDTRADHLIYIAFDFKNLRGQIVFNGPERLALTGMAVSWLGQRPVSNQAIRRLNALVKDGDRLPLVDPAPQGHPPKIEASIL